MNSLPFEVVLPHSKNFVAAILPDDFVPFVSRETQVDTRRSFIEESDESDLVEGVQDGYDNDVE